MDTCYEMAQKIQDEMLNSNSKEFYIGCYGSITNVPWINLDNLKENFEDSCITLTINHNRYNVDVGVFYKGCGMEKLYQSYQYNETTWINFLAHLLYKTPTISITDDTGRNYNL